MTGFNDVSIIRRNKLLKHIIKNIKKRATKSWQTAIQSAGNFSVIVNIRYNNPNIFPWG